MSEAPGEDAGWYYDLERAEGVDPVFVDESTESRYMACKNQSNPGICEKCGVESADVKLGGPEGHVVCPPCREELQEWYDENAPNPCIACGYWSTDDSELCAPCIEKYESAEGYRRYQRNKNKYANVVPPGRRK